MRQHILSVIVGIVIFIIWFAPAHAIWVSGYYPGWTQSRLKPSDIDFSAITHLMHFSVIPKSDGSLDTSANGLTNVSQVVSAAHGAGKKIILVVGGANSRSAFSAATTDTNRPRLVSALVNFVKSNGYDGVDVDWEPTPSGDKARYDAFIRDLRAALNAQVPGGLLTAAVYDNNEGRAIVQGLTDQFDQINMMTYIMSGSWTGQTWHNSPLYSNSGNLPSIDADVTSFTGAGIPKAKLGIGAEFVGFVWNGANAPKQSFSGSIDSEVPYYTIMSQYYQPQYYHFDSEAQVPYLSIGSGSSGKFISYEDEQSLTKKVEYIKTKGLGGLIIWELSQGWITGNPAGQRDPLLQAVKAAVGGQTGPSPTSPPTASPTTGPTTIPTGPSCSSVQGDTNNDGRVTLVDYQVWRTAFTTKQ